MKLAPRKNWLRHDKTFGTEFLDVITHHPIIESDLLGNIEDRMLTFKSHHDLFDGAVEFPIIAPIHPQTIAAKKHGPRNVRLGM